MSAPWLAVPRSLRGAAAVTSRPASALRSSPSSFFSSSPLVICRQCRRSRFGSPRAYSSSPVLPQPPAAGVAALASRRLISVAGPDAAKFLQGVITSSILRLQNGHKGDGDGGGNNNASARAAPSGLYSAFLSAQGRVLHDVFVYRDTLGVGKLNATGDDAMSMAMPMSFIIEVDADEAATLTKHIKRYKLRAKFDVRLLDAAELTVWHGWGLPDGQQELEQQQGSVISHHDTRAPGLGWRFVTRASASSASSSSPPSPPPQLELDVADESAYRVHRYLLGVAEGQREILRNQALPLESNIDLMGGIDFHKGCYVGQELTIRTRHRGVVRKRILPCIVYGAEEDQPQVLQFPFDGAATTDHQYLAATIPSETSVGRVGKKGRSAGKWLSGVGNLGLALCRLETMTDVVLPGEAAAAAATAAATFDPASEFVMNVVEKNDSEGEGGKEAAAASGTATAVKIKAFVPDWLRQGLAPEAAH